MIVLQFLLKKEIVPLFQTLLLSKDGLFQYTTGKVVDLVSNDVQRLEGETIKWIFFGFFTLIELLFISFLMVYFIGWQSLMGVLFFIFSFRISSYYPKGVLFCTCVQQRSLTNASL